MYLFSLFLLSLFRYNVLRSGANPAMLEGSRRTNEVSPAEGLMLRKYYPSSLEGRGGDEVDGVRCFRSQALIGWHPLIGLRDHCIYLAQNSCKRIQSQTCLSYVECSRIYLKDAILVPAKAETQIYLKALLSAAENM